MLAPCLNSTSEARQVSSTLQSAVPLALSSSPPPSALPPPSTARPCELVGVVCSHLLYAATPPPLSEPWCFFFFSTCDCALAFVALLCLPLLFWVFSSHFTCVNTRLLLASCCSSSLAFFFQPSLVVLERTGTRLPFRSCASVSCVCVCLRVRVLFLLLQFFLLCCAVQFGVAFSLLVFLFCFVLRRHLASLLRAFCVFFGLFRAASPPSLPLICVPPFSHPHRLP